MTYQLFATIFDAVSHFWRYGVSSANKGRDVFKTYFKQINSNHQRLSLY
jgi:hypothetical protein